MKSIRVIFVTIGVLVASAGIVAARVVRIWSPRELLDKSDLVVIATLTASHDTREHIELPGFVGEHVIGVDSQFAVSAVLKGNTSKTNIVLHHYRATDGTNISHVPNGPTFISFPPSE